jgi:hypothetical protein
MIIVLTYFEISHPGKIDAIDDNSPMLAILGLGFIGVMLFNLTALVVGIVGLFDRKQRKPLCILGVGFSFFLFVLIAFLFVLGNYYG